MLEDKICQEKKNKTKTNKKTEKVFDLIKIWKCNSNLLKIDTLTRKKKDMTALSQVYVNETSVMLQQRVCHGGTN